MTRRLAVDDVPALCREALLGEGFAKVARTGEDLEEAEAKAVRL
eukprot:CAMPEP_0195143722 /NCGR_PEP_ID=MMETSP0448-20130528/166843_1 /TAXON_ID=66468 /ORGANISM="Heterocapsa triquestra, Strain CCMP 448" /LENGTH=43 /DNA_ID= /DNA_START= /DNA_END= /DNA_ORIENTATION=